MNEISWDCSGTLAMFAALYGYTGLEARARTTAVFNELGSLCRVGNDQQMMKRIKDQGTWMLEIVEGTYNNSCAIWAVIHRDGTLIQAGRVICCTTSHARFIKTTGNDVKKRLSHIKLKPSAQLAVTFELQWLNWHIADSPSKSFTPIVISISVDWANNA